MKSRRNVKFIRFFSIFSLYFIVANCAKKSNLQPKDGLQDVDKNIDQFQKKPDSNGTCNEIEHPNYAESVKATAEKYCVSCHSVGSAAGGLRLDAYDIPEEIDNPNSRWTRALSRVTEQTMPPANMDRPTPCEIKNWQKWIEKGAPENAKDNDEGDPETCSLDNFMISSSPINRLSKREYTTPS